MNARLVECLTNCCIVRRRGSLSLQLLHNYQDTLNCSIHFCSPLLSRCCLKDRGKGNFYKALSCLDVSTEWESLVEGKNPQAAETTAAF